MRPGKPVENVYDESFNVKLRDECLNEQWLTSLNHVRVLIGQWQQARGLGRAYRHLKRLPHHGSHSSREHSPREHRNHRW
ncbi:MAG: transposase [Burkholderiales bacterium]|nr:integrase core domain-containing protein [Burkholderiales bacterium]MBZ0251124.1 transposase [Burkholderiales bacterium]